MDLSPGVYSIEHDSYFKKHASALRMESVFEKWKQNKSAPKLSRAQYNVMRGELRVLFNSKKFPALNKLINSEQIDTNPLPASALNYYFEKIYPDRKTIAMANKMDQGFDWNEMKGEKFEAFLEKYKKMMEQKAPEEQNEAFLNFTPLSTLSSNNPQAVFDPTSNKSFLTPKGFEIPNNWTKTPFGILPPTDWKPTKEWKEVSLKNLK